MKAHTLSEGSILSVRIPAYILLLFLILASGLIYFGRNSFHVNPPPVMRQDIKLLPSGSGHSIRVNDYEFTKPILMGDLDHEDSRLFPLKDRINQYIEQQKTAGVISSASVYVRLSNNGSYISINDGEQFSPGSLMKVPTLITYLKVAERDPQVFKKEIFFKKHFSVIPAQTITGEIMEEGRNYTVKDLLYRMVVFSDNDATALLNANINFPVMQKLFTDLQLPEPRLNQQDYPMAISDYSRFFRVLYNGTYLDWDMSQYALSLLTQSTFKDGIVKHLPPGIKVARKFGERNNNGEQQLHEFGIVYIGDNPYMIGVMTKGKDNLLLPQVITGVSDIVYQQMKSSEVQSPN